MHPDDPRYRLYLDLLAEQHNSGGWKTPRPQTQPDNEMACARRRREAADEAERLERRTRGQDQRRQA